MRLLSISRVRLTGFCTDEQNTPRLWGDAEFDDGVTALFHYDPLEQTVQVKRRVPRPGGDYHYELCNDPDRIHLVAEMAPLHWDNAVHEAAKAQASAASWDADRRAHVGKLEAGAALYEALLVVLAEGLTPQARIKAEAAIGQAEGEGASEYLISHINTPNVVHRVVTADPFDALRSHMFRQPLRSRTDDWTVTPAEPRP